MRLVRWLAVGVGVLGAVAGSGARAAAPVPTPSERTCRTPHAPAVATYLEENRGQTDARVDFVARCRGYVAFLTPGGATFKTAAGAFRMGFVGADAAVHGRPAAVAPGRSNYFIGNDPSLWRTDVPHFVGAAYDGMLPGVDVLWRGEGRALEYDVVLAPQADPAAVRLSFEGADAVAVDGRGDLVLDVAGGRAVMSPPRAYQEIDGARRAVKAAFVVGADRTVGFEVGGRDTERPLVIDPSLTVSTYIGGSNTDYAARATTDAADNLYVGGITYSSDFPVSTGAFQTAKGDSSSTLFDGFVQKYSSAAASLVYATYVGGNSNDDVAGLVVDASGNAFISGSAGSTNFPLVNPYQTTGSSFLGKLNSNGNALSWSTRLAPYLQVLGLDSSNNVYGLSPGTGARLVKFNSSGTTLYYDVYNFSGGTANSDIHDIAVDPSGAVWVVGSIQSGGNNYASNPSYQTAYAGGASDGWIINFNTSGSVTYQTYIGGGGTDRVRGVALDSSGGLVLMGDTSSTNFPTLNPYQSANGGGGTDLWVARMNWLLATANG